VGRLPDVRPIRRLLVANRAEIASRVLRTARARGTTTVAVFSDVDAGLPYVAEADTAMHLPGTASAPDATAAPTSRSARR